MESGKFDLKKMVRRSKLYVPANREKFIAKAWTRGADCVILDLEDAVAPADKSSARKMIREEIPIVGKGGAEVQVRINREFEEEDLDSVVLPGLTSIMIPKCESVEEIRRIDRMVTQLEEERGLPVGKIQFDLIFETARGIVRVEEVAEASPRIVSMTTGQADLSVDLGFTRYPELNFDQYFYAENRLLYAARAAGVQAHGLGAQKNVDFVNISAGREAMLNACRYAYNMGFMGTSAIHPGWVEVANEGFSPPREEVALARRVKEALSQAYERGEGSVSVDGRMYDVANMKHVTSLLARAEAVEKRDAEKAAAVAATGPTG
ncbi:MAG: CoA ester lyase [Proteobacteria bacterium]|nr:CoA ester lyase [Pseudomonadota bacterium]MBU2228150.1 CoA ester lyase [Pseudomonadota bacterium]MBU2262471.1 CoA ester lyase [Pseudomonadota bacterium]